MCREIIDSVLSGNKDSFRELVSLYKHGAWNLAISVLKNDFYAQDAVQQAFVNAWLNLHTYRKDAPFKFWFQKILINECYRILKKHPDIHQPKPDDAVFEPETPGPDDNPDYDSDISHLKFHINTALGKMTPDYSLVLKLFYIESYSIQEISSVTGWTPAVTKVKLHRARKSMKRYLTTKLNLEPEALYL